jgi:hypothetical protein
MIIIKAKLSRLAIHRYKMIFALDIFVFNRMATGLLITRFASPDGGAYREGSGAGDRIRPQNPNPH